MKTEQIHLALKQNQQTFKLAITDDLKTIKANFSEEIKKLNDVLNEIDKADTKLLDAKIKFTEAKDHGNIILGSAQQARQKAEPTLKEVESTTSQLGIAATSIPGYADVLNLQSQLNKYINELVQIKRS